MSLFIRTVSKVVINELSGVKLFFHCIKMARTIPVTLVYYTFEATKICVATSATKAVDLLQVHNAV